MKTNETLRFSNITRLSRREGVSKEGWESWRRRNREHGFFS